MVVPGSPGARRKASTLPNQGRSSGAILEEESKDQIYHSPLPEEKLQEKRPSDTSKGPFVRNYRGKNSSGSSGGGYRMSMTIRPQTVANLASKFDTIVKDQQPANKQTGSQGLKLRTYDITKIISELNKLNNGEDQFGVKSKPNTSKTEKHFPDEGCDGSSGGSGGAPAEDGCGGRNHRAGRDSGGAAGPASHAKTTASQEQAGTGHDAATTRLQDGGGASLPGHTSRVEAARPGGSNPGLAGKDCLRSGDAESRTAAPATSTTTIPSTASLSSLPPSSLAQGKAGRKGLAVSFSSPEQVHIFMSS